MAKKSTPSPNDVIILNLNSLEPRTRAALEDLDSEITWTLHILEDLCGKRWILLCKVNPKPPSAT